METTLREGFLDDLRAHVKAIETHEFDRDWTIYAARLEGEKMADIADAANLSRMQVSRIIAHMKGYVDTILTAYPNLTRQNVFDHAWKCETWAEFESRDIMYNPKQERFIIHRDRTFDFGGQKFQVLYGGPGDGYEVHAINEWSSGTDIEQALTLRELRQELQYRLENDIPIRVLLPGDRMDLEGTIWRDGEAL